MTEIFNTYIKNIDSDFWRDLCVREGTLLHFERGEEFVTVGEVARYIGYIRSGLMKYVAYSDNGTGHVVGLEYEGEFVADFPFSLYGKTSRVSIVAAAACEIYCYPVSEIANRLENDNTLRNAVHHSTEAVFSTLYDRYIDLYCKTPQQRYDELITHYPDLFKRFPLRDISSFLNITPTHLSRLRAIKNA